MLQYVFTATSFLGTASVFAGVIAKNSLFDHFLTVVGVLGMFATFALFFREARLNSETNRLIKQGQLYEQMMQIPSTMFSQDRWGELSTLLIYSGAFCVGTWFVLTPGFSLILAFPVFVITYLLKRLIRNRILSGSVS
jgi:flagellar biogenesis protein FliO